MDFITWRDQNGDWLANRGIAIGDARLIFEAGMKYNTDRSDSEGQNELRVMPNGVLAGGLTATNKEIAKLANDFFYNFMIQFDENGLSAPEHIMRRRAYSILNELTDLYNNSQREA